MYGIIHAGLKALVEAKGGSTAWPNVLDRAGQTDASILVYNRYSDESTLALVAAAADELGTTVPEALRAFGAHWIRWAAHSGYGSWFSGGASLFDALDGLDDMHTRLAVTFPGYRPPSIVCRRLGPRTAEVEWRSDRAGLAPMMLGMLEALGDHRGEPCVVAMVEETPQGARFLVSLQDSA
jgi:hypothetical protein